MAEPNGQSFEPTVLTAVWRYRWLVLFLAIAFAGLGWLYASQTSQWSAEATLAVQDPRSSNLFDQGFRDVPERYVEGQVAILRSRAVARRAVDIASEQTPPIEVTVDDIVEGLDVSASSSSDIVTLSYTAATQREAIGVVNAVAAAYEDIGRLTANAQFADAVDELDRSIDELQHELVTLESQISTRQQRVLDDLANDPDRIADLLLLAQLTEELHALEVPPASSADGRFSRFASELQILTVRIETVSSDLEQERTVVLALERENPERAVLVGLQSEAQRRLTDLQTRRDQLAVDADLASSGVVFASPAETATPSGAGLFVVLGMLVGLMIGALIAVLLASRRRRFGTRSEPETVLGTRLLADVPNFKDERVGSMLPVVDAPTSASAEAFRFVSASVSLQQLWPANDDGKKNFKSVVTLSAGLSEGKTVVTANTAFAAAREGHSVLIVDADFGNQELTELLLGPVPPPVGMTNVVAKESTLAKSVVDIPHDGAGSIGLLSRGTSPVRAPDFYSAPATAKLFDQIAAKYDLVLIDAPPLLRVAYATTLARLADRAMIVVAHGEDVHAVEELHDQLELVGIPLIGYVYNLAPLRSEMTVSAGSMADTLGEHPTFTVSKE
ncbi:MAG: Wzz/FepE/Etk N-terminal domain-containing protein [Actinomycetota bacterium]|nr:Wzz/FepE/Etk N-terminal domain-containing protein [Actinomycetota bacterium]